MIPHLLILPLKLVSLCVRIKSSRILANLRTVGEHDQQAEIDSFRESCDISVILNKIATGEVSTEFTDEDCLDLVEMPQSLVECLDVRDAWEQQQLIDVDDPK